MGLMSATLTGGMASLTMSTVTNTVPGLGGMGGGIMSPARDLRLMFVSKQQGSPVLHNIKQGK